MTSASRCAQLVLACTFAFTPAAVLTSTPTARALLASRIATHLPSRSARSSPDDHAALP
eukprot:CAMPEP_0174734446 /NCGR_PEP_ID=MMETSP1094-20130205/63319_1 /TAXON_ID=156173 /ORGANISM="Chrysochromulina brevifilum, Strain UTEX LB 985" /LENGTH=58 /DNA_ID=CAMNT_0015937261 /DNA_START=86 /DNA_END=259 /DNA_ORIENTATION=-